ncbi:MAG: phosphotransferase [Oceanospirillaceae bacterium]|nr:phosphotransferase [Oceanospirillaceae bacterium]
MQHISELSGWVETLIDDGQLSLGAKWEILPLQGDASCRRYYRLIGGSISYILVASPSQRIDNNIFVTIARDWLAHGINVPEVIAINESQGFMLLEDLGTVHLYDISYQQANIGYYRQAITQLHKIQSVPAVTMPSFDRDFLLRELNIFDTWMIQSVLELPRPELLDDLFEMLVENALAQPQVMMHRDFHSRNLLIFHNEIKIIDFQDAVCGPLAYDLASLLKDCYLTLSDAELDALVDEYLVTLNSSELLEDPIEKSVFRRWFDLIGLQRHLKVLGLFVRLAKEEQKSGYLSDISRVFNYVLNVTNRYDELGGFDLWLRKTVKPELLKQSWYVS